MKRVFLLLLFISLLWIPTWAQSRKSPGRHTVRGHFRNGKWVNSHKRGRGSVNRRGTSGRSAMGNASSRTGSFEEYDWAAEAERVRRAENERARQAAQQAWNEMLGYSAHGDTATTKNDPVYDDKKEAARFQEKRKAKEDAAKLTLFYGMCTNVIDGDTIEVKRGKLTETVRIFGIEAPELTQPRGTDVLVRVKKALLGQYVSVAPSAIGDDGILIGGVALGKSWVNVELLKAGLVWCQPGLNGRQDDLIKYEKWARSQKAGIWADNDLVSPWEWRKTQELKKDN